MTAIERAFLTDIAAQPQDDFPRLAYADWLEEHGEEERAEFIRVQVELARFPAVCPGCNRGHESGVVLAIVCDACERQDALRRREQDLLGQHFHAWRLSPYIQACVVQTLPSPFFTGVFCRGFIKSLEGKCTDWLQHAADIIEAVPMLEEVRLSDRKPLVSQLEDRPPLYAWMKNDRLTFLGDLPKRLWDYLPEEIIDPAGAYKFYPTLDAATAALSAACLAFAHDQLAARREIRTAEYLFGQVFTDSTTP